MAIQRIGERMADLGKKKRHVWLIAGGGFSLLIVGALLLSELIFSRKAMIREAVSRLERNASGPLLTVLGHDPRRGPEIASLLKDFPGLTKDESDFCTAIFEKTPWPIFLFVDHHVPSPRCAELAECVKAAARDGVDPADFGMEALAALSDGLRNKPVPPLPLTLDPAEKQEMVDLLAAESDGLPLDAASLLAWLTDPARISRFPRLRAAYDRAWDIYLARYREEMRLELSFTVAFVRFLQNMGVPKEEWAGLRARACTGMAKTLESLPPKDERYERLRAELDRYGKLAAAHGEFEPVQVAAGAKLKMGDGGTVVATLQKRLALEGYYTGEAHGEFDTATMEALRVFQRCHQIQDDGVLGKDTADALNVPFSARVDQLRLAMVKYRTSPTRREPLYVRVNIPEYMVEIVEQGKVLRRHRVVVGNLKEENHTPELRSDIERIVYNPSWFITRRIFKEEEYPKFLKDSTYFSRKGYIVKYGSNGRPVAAQEPPGPGNALGKVKILFPNPHDVYMHDTPKKSLFATTQRTYSHGCIRLQDPLEFVEFFLKREDNPVLPKIPRILQKNDTYWVTLKNKVPIFLEYCTITVGQDGRAVFLRDVYKRDGNLLTAMRERREKSRSTS